jgi:hypothetical protein
MSTQTSEFVFALAKSPLLVVEFLTPSTVIGRVLSRGVVRWSKPLAKRALGERRSERAACGGDR